APLPDNVRRNVSEDLCICSAHRTYGRFQSTARSLLLLLLPLSGQTPVCSTAPADVLPQFPLCFHDILADTPQVLYPPLIRLSPPGPPPLSLLPLSDSSGCH